MFIIIINYFNRIKLKKKCLIHPKKPTNRAHTLLNVIFKTRIIKHEADLVLIMSIISKFTLLYSFLL